MADVPSSQSSRPVLDHLTVENASEAVQQARAALDDSLESAATFIRERPIACLAGALALGYVLGKIVSH
jgi:ElaB/YqjD/DUF883 family membrane-anchored ribosome-binding protein